MAESAGRETGAFRYSQLKSPRSIRLAKLSASAKFDDPLEISLEEVHLDDISKHSIEYDALSYVWGLPHGTRPLQCDNRTLLVTPNCESALLFLRLRNETRTLWIDAICINQAKDQAGFDERATQIPLIGEVYAIARRTFCWLGNGHSYTDVVMQHLKRIGECPSERGLAKLMRIEESLQGDGTLGQESSCLDHIFCHPWHSRVWTIQEVAFSQNCHVVCGKSSVPWEQYSAAAMYLIHDHFLEHLDIQAARSVASIDTRNVLHDYLTGKYSDESQGDETTLEDLRAQKSTFLTSCLTDMNQLQATDPKDKVYGLYAVYSRLGIPLPCADYRKSVADVYIDAAVGMISWSATLDVLRDSCSISRDPALPSWIPDWNDHEVRMFIPEGYATRGSRIVDCNPQGVSPSRGVLCVRGKLVGQVAPIHTGLATMPYPTRSDSVKLPILSGVEHPSFQDIEFLRLLVDQIRFFRDLYHLVQSEPPILLEEDTEELFSDILGLRNRFSDWDIFETWSDLLKYHDNNFNLTFGSTLAESWRAADQEHASGWTLELIHCATIAASVLTRSITKDDEALSCHDELLDFMKELSQNLADQAVIRVQDASTQQETLGTTFQSVKVGDEIALLQGASWPVVLRPNKNDWSFIGPAFVFGMMAGQRWPDEDDAVTGLRQFMLA